jgi:SAM-dependent methyltransferase
VKDSLFTRPRVRVSFLLHPGNLRSGKMLALVSARARARSIVASAAARNYKEIPSFREVEWPEEWPFADPKFFARMDEEPDTVFYETPRFVTHIDDGAIGAITDYYAATMREGADVLDLCSSWISHLPPDLKLGRMAGIGMNEEELKKNERLGEYVVQDMNLNTKLPYEDDSFDFICNVVSVECVTRPSNSELLRSCVLPSLLNVPGSILSWSTVTSTSRWRSSTRCIGCSGRVVRPS